MPETVTALIALGSGLVRMQQILLSSTMYQNLFLTWNEIDLNSPILIDASQELWLGYVCSSLNAWDFPAACDDGPALTI